MLKTVSSAGGGSGGTVTNIATGTGLTGGPITTTGTIALANTAVTAGIYGDASTVPQVTINAQGQATSVANVTISIANSAVTGLGTMSIQNANAVTITGGTVNSTSITVKDNVFTLQDDVDSTKQAQFQLSGLTTGTTFTYNLPTLSGSTFAVLGLAQTFTALQTYNSGITIAAGNFTLSGPAAGIQATAQTTGSSTIGGTSQTGALTFGQSAASQTVNVATGATSSGNTTTVNIGTGGLSGSTTVVNIGSATGTSTVTFNGGISATSLASGTITFGGTSQTGTNTFGQSTVSGTTNIASGATASGSTKTINFGANGLSGSTTTINIGSSVSGATSTTALNGITTTAGVRQALTTKTGAYTLTTLDYTVLGNASTASFSLTLPTAVGATGQVYIIKKVDSTANTVTILTTSSQLIDGQSSKVLSYQYDGLQLQSDNANWMIIGNTFGRNGTSGTF